jgi:FMN phosphatase YigB (HAD superfamily)
MALQLDVEPEEMVYVGDDPHLDFIAPRQLGLGTVRVIHKGTDNATRASPTALHEAHITIPSLDMLWEALQMLERSCADQRPTGGTHATTLN